MSTSICPMSMVSGASGPRRTAAARLVLWGCAPLLALATQAAGNPVPGAAMAASAVPLAPSAAVARAAPLPVAAAVLGQPASAAVAGLRTAPTATKATKFTKATAPWVALDAGHRPGEGSRAASGLVEHNFNLRFVALLEADLRQRGLRVVRLPSTLSAADRARRAQGASLLVSIHHEGAAVSHPAAARGTTGNARTAATVGAIDATSAGRLVPVVARQQAGGEAAASPGRVFDTGYAVFVGTRDAAALPCARTVARALQTTGRPFSEHHGQPMAGEGHAWVDRSLGVLRHAHQPLLAAAATSVPALMVDVAHIARPSEEKLARDPVWVRNQAAAVARGVQRCMAGAV